MIERETPERLMPNLVKIWEGPLHELHGPSEVSDEFSHIEWLEADEIRTWGSQGLILSTNGELSEDLKLINKALVDEGADSLLSVKSRQLNVAVVSKRPPLH